MTSHERLPFEVALDAPGEILSLTPSLPRLLTSLRLPYLTPFPPPPGAPSQNCTQLSKCPSASQQPDSGGNSASLPRKEGLCKQCLSQRGRGGHRCLRQLPGEDWPSGLLCSLELQNMNSKSKETWQVIRPKLPSFRTRKQTQRAPRGWVSRNHNWSREGTQSHRYRCHPGARDRNAAFHSPHLAPISDL